MATLYKPYCSLEDVVQAAGNSEPEVSDIFIESINLASRRIDEICGRDFWSHDHLTDPYIVPRRRVIGNVVILPFEINSLTEVKLDTIEIDLASLSYAEGDTFFEYSSNFGSIPFTGELAIKGDFGFATTLLTAPPALIPASIRRATILTACALSSEWRRERVAFDGSRESLLETKVPSEVNELVKPWIQRGRAVGF
jgi:hypothetical protein